MHTEEIDRSDPQAVLVDDEGGLSMSNFRIVDELDENQRPTGFKLGIPTEEEKVKIERHISEELSIAEKEYAPIWERMARNIAAFEALPSGDKEDFLTLPVGKTASLHLIAYFVNRIHNKRPIATVLPEEFGMYEVPVPQDVDPWGQVMSKVELRSSEELVQQGENLLEHYLRGGKVKFREFLYNTVTNCVRGAPPWGKTCYEKTLRPQKVPNWKRTGQGMIVMDGYREVERVVGSPHKLISRSGFDVMMAAPWIDPQEAEWVSEHVPHTLAEGRNKLKSNEWYLCTDEDWEQMRKAVTDLRRYEEKREAQGKIQKQIDQPRSFLDVYYVWLYWPVILDDESGETMEGIMSFLCPFERTTGKLLAMPLNPYAHGRRNLVPYVQRPRVDEIGGYSTMEDVLPLQKVKTRLFHSQVQNAMLANTVWTKVRPGSTAWQWLKSNEIRARSKVPVQNDNDLKSEVLGRELRSLSPEIAALDGWTKELSVSDTVKGATLLGRTSRAAISLVQEAGLTVPNMDLDFITERLGENLTMLYRDIGQWSAYGAEIPYIEPATRAMTMKAIEFPIDGLNLFSVRISASSDEETAQFEFERNLGLAKLQSEKFRETAELFGPMVDPEAPPVMEEILKPQIIAQQLLLARIYELAKLDPDKYTLTERKIDEILARHREWVAQKQAEAAAAAQAPPAGGPSGATPPGAGAGNVIPGAFGGGAAPGAAPAIPEGLV